MNDIPQKRLRDILGQFGHEVCNDPKRCEALLNDLCPEHKREIRILVAALKEGIVADMMTSQGSVTLSMSIGRLAKRLHDNSGIAEQFALWSVESWAVALGLASEYDVGKLNFTCPLCKASGKAPSKYAGKLVQCPKCKGSVKISPDGKNFAPDNNEKPAAEEMYYKINDPDPDQAEQLKERAVNAAKSNKFETAIRLIEEAIRMNTSKSLEDYGVIKAELYKLIGNEKPNQAIEMYGRGVRLKAKERYIAAISSYEEAITLDPNFAWSYNNLAWLLSTAKNPSVHDGQRAVELATRACELSNWSCWAFFGTLSAAYARAGDFAKAIEVGEASLRLFPDNHKPYHRVKLRGFRRGDAHIDEGEPIAGGKAPSEEREPPQDGLNGNDQTRYLSTEGFRKTRWGMSPMEVSNFYPDAVEDEDGDLVVEKKVAGEKSKIVFIFASNLLWRVLIHQAYGMDGDSAASRFLHLYNTLKERYGDTVGEGLNWHSQSQYNREDQSIWGLAIAAGHLSMFATWKTEETALFLACQRQEMGGVFNSMDYRSIPIWEAIEQANSSEHAGAEETSSHHKSHVEERVFEIVSEQMGVAREQIARETSFVTDLGVDSLDTVELVMEFEEEFDITIPDEEAERISTIGQAIDYIEHHIK